MSARVLLPKTKILLCFALLISALVLFGDRHLNVPQAEDRVRLQPVDPNDVFEIELLKATETVKLSRSGEERWMITAPFDDRADHSRVMSLLMAFRKGVIFDALIDRGDDRRYGMDPSTAVSVVLKGKSGQELVSIVVGKDTEQGSSYVRLSNSTEVYRAQLGRRQRFDQAPDAWRNQLLIDLAPEQVQALQVISPASTFEIKAEAPEGAQLRWSLMEDEKELGIKALDQEKILKFVQRVGHLRVGRAVEVDSPETALEIRVSSVMGEQILRFGEPSQGRVLVSLEADVYEVASPAVEQVLRGSNVFLNRRLFRFVPRQDFDTLGLQRPSQPLRLLQQDLSTGFWRLVRPSNVDIDPRQAFFAINTFASLEYIGAELSTLTLVPEQAVVLTLQLLTGQKHHLSLYPLPESEHCVMVLDQGSPQLISQDSVDTIAKGFGLESIF